MTVYNRISGYLANNKTLVKIFLVYFFLTFTIGYLDFDRRVQDFGSSTEILMQVIEGKHGPPISHRLLVPYLVYFFHKISHMPLDYSFAIFRFIFFFLSFILFHLYLKKWFDDRVAMIGTLSLIASLPLILTNWYCIPTDIPELITFILAAMWIRDNKYRNLLILIPIATLNRETAIAFVLLYFLNGIGKEKGYLLIRRTMSCFLSWLIPYIILISIFGVRKHPYFFSVFVHNCKGLSQIFTSPNLYNYYYFLIYLCGFYWILAFMDFNRKDVFLKRSAIFMGLYFLYAFFIAGGINEVRMFIPFYVFVIPLGLFSLFKNETQNP